MSDIINLRGELPIVNRFLESLHAEQVEFMVSTPSVIADHNGVIGPDTQVELVDVLVNLGLTIVGGTIVGVLQRAVIERIIKDARTAGLEVEHRSAPTSGVPEPPKGSGSSQ